MKYVVIIAITAILTFGICNAGTILGFISTMAGKGDRAPGATPAAREDAGTAAFIATKQA